MATKTGAGGQPQEYDAKTGKYGGEHRQNTSHSAILADQKRRDAAMIYDTTNGLVHKISGAISGALDPNSKEADEHAEKYYEFLRKRKDDIRKIARNTGIEEVSIRKIKNYLFVDAHDLGDRKCRFFPDYDIAQSWQRLEQGKFEPHDILLLKHEEMEMALVDKGFTQRQAHEITQRKYNYKAAVKKFNDGRKRRSKNGNN